MQLSIRRAFTMVWNLSELSACTAKGLPQSVWAGARSQRHKPKTHHAEGPLKPPGGALAEGLSLRVASAAGAGVVAASVASLSGASADQVPSHRRRRDLPGGREHSLHGAGHRADCRGRALYEVSQASYGASDARPGVELLYAHRLPLFPSARQIGNDPHRLRKTPLPSSRRWSRATSLTPVYDTITLRDGHTSS
jgi:hypothetical protein